MCVCVDGGVFGVVVVVFLIFFLGGGRLAKITLVSKHGA